MIDKISLLYMKKYKKNTSKKLCDKDSKVDEFFQYRPLQKFVDRLIFKKLKYAIKNFCSGMTPELLEAISPRLYNQVYTNNKAIEIKFKLLGIT